MDADYTIKITEDEQSDVPNIRRGSTVYVKIQRTAKAMDFVVTKDLKVTQAKEETDNIFGKIIMVEHDMTVNNSFIIHNNNNWFGVSEEDMKEINETYPFRCQADVDEHERRIEEKIQTFLRKKEKLQEMPVS